MPARTSSFAYQGHDIDVRRIATELDVGTVLEGSVRAAGERIRITAQLIDGESGYHLWSEHYDRRFEDLFELQDELASAIILQTLNVALAGPDRDTGYGPLRLTVSRPIGFTWRRWPNITAWVSASTGLRQAAAGAQAGSRFAQARTALGRVRSIASFTACHCPGRWRTPKQEVRQALNADPESAATHAALGVIRAAQARWLEAEASYQQALALDDADPWTWRSHAIEVLSTVGHLRANFRARGRPTASRRRGPGPTSTLQRRTSSAGNDGEARTPRSGGRRLGRATNGIAPGRHTVAGRPPCGAVRGGTGADAGGLCGRCRKRLGRSRP